MMQKIHSNRAAGWWVDVLDRGYFQYKDDQGTTAKMFLDENEENRFHRIDWIHQDYIEFNRRIGVSRYLETIQHLSGALNKLGISFVSGDRKTIEGRKQTLWIFSSLDKLRNEWEEITGNKKWSEALDLDEDVMGQLTNDTTSPEDMVEEMWGKVKVHIAEKKKKKLV